MALSFDTPVMSLPDGLQVASTTRGGGVSHGAYDSLNLADHVGDDPARVTANRMRLTQALHLPAAPHWLTQVHSNRISLAGEADGSYTAMRRTVLAIQTADCLPIVIWNDKGDEVAAVHAGWKGLASNIIQSAVTRFDRKPGYAWIGPHIQSCHYEVDGHLYDIFADDRDAFSKGRDAAHWQMALAQIARRQLEASGVSRVEVTQACTACDSDRYFSYRRDGECGRMATLVWRQ